MHDTVLDMANQMNIVHNQPAPLVMGRHLIDLGLAPGIQFGVILADAFQAQLDGEFSDLNSGIQWVTDRL